MRNYETKVYNYVDKKTGAHIVKAVTMYMDEYVTATAKCNPEDEFNLELGTAIALTRLDIKIAKKRKASMKAWAKHCRECLYEIEIDKRRTKKALEYAEGAFIDRKVELKKLEKQLSELLGDN